MVHEDQQHLGLNELVHHVLEHRVRQDEEHPTEELVQPTADGDQSVLSDPATDQTHPLTQRHGDQGTATSVKM